MIKNKTILLAFLPVASLLIGFIEYGPARAPSYAHTLTIIQACLSVAIVFLWFRGDAIERQYPTSLFLKAAMLGLAIFALPYYLLKSRGLPGSIRALGLSMLVFVGTMVAFRLGVWLG